MTQQEQIVDLFEQCDRVIEGLRKQCGFPLSDYDDLKQEMALALLDGPPGEDSFRLCQAAWRALDWLRKTYGLRITGGLVTVADLTPLIDAGACREVWA